MTTGRASIDTAPGGPPVGWEQPVVEVSPQASDRPLPWGAALYAALIVTFVRPSLWLVSLAGFLARGGLVLLLAPILVLPTPSGITNLVGGPVASLMFGEPSPILVLVIAGSIALAIGLLLAGTLIGAWAERIVIAASLDVGAEEGLIAPAGGRARLRRGIGAVAAIRLLGLVPLAIALAAAADPLYHAIYHQLVLPDDMSASLIVRILGDIPLPLLFIAVCWLLGDAAAALGVRRLVLEDRSIPIAALLGWAWLARRCYRVIPTALATTGLVVLLVAPPVVAAATGWTRLRGLLADAGDIPSIALGVGLFITVWIGGLVLAGAGATFRGAAWTFELTRRPGPSSPRP
jgi:hypothetical protein